MNKLFKLSTTVSIYCLCTLLSFDSYAYQPPFSWVAGSLHKSSLANKEQLEQLLEVVMQEIASQRSNEESIVILNRKLEMLKLPLIQPNPRISIVGGNGIAPSTEGATIADSNYQYCLPCKTGWNQYDFGIIPVQTKPTEQ